VIDSSNYRAMLSLLEQKARDLAHLQHQAEELQYRLEVYLPGGHAPAHGEGSSLQPAAPSEEGAPQHRPLSREQVPGGALGRSLPRRITVTLNDHVHQLLIERSCAEGRSVSNLAAFIIESHLGDR
jgi:hypothetical protein